ncbi:MULTISPECIES: NAD(P)/FAD-dependent oxidoreductase [Lysobacter]|uniref:FAD-dependent oxidoreductase n=1 Tax=Lysobacter firmicutimachus TaxID=1792846 RepID=A0ABU8D026_9GAMM|nr:FAD-dependent oxidoreductase [Lysobacter antibioticus]
MGEAEVAEAQARTDRGRSDVIVVGAGVIGLACALALLETGRSVRVIDAGRIGGGSSHGNCGTITPSHATPLAAPGVIAQALRWMLTPDAPLYVHPKLDLQLWGWLLRFAARCNERDWRASAQAKSALLNDSRARLEDWVGRYGLVCEFDNAGVDYVFRERKSFEGGQFELDLLREFGIQVEVIDGARYEAQDPAFKPGVAGAIRFEHDAVLRPDRYVAELARTVCARGGDLIEQCRLQDLQRDGEEYRALTSQGVLRAGQVVVATGAWSPKLSQLIGLSSLPRAMQPGKGYSITYDRPALVPRRPVVLRERKVCVTMWDSGFRLGSTMEFSGYDESLNPRRLAALERGAAEYLHHPVGPVERERWYGWRPMSVDDVPIVGAVPGRDGLWLATGHGMMGVSMSAGTGQLIADLIAGRAPAIDPHPYRPERFA